MAHDDKQPRKLAGAPDATGGQFDHKQWGEPDPSVNLAAASGSTAVLEGTMWHLPDWEDIDHESNDVAIYARESINRQLHARGMSERDTAIVFANGEQVHFVEAAEEITQEALARIYRKAEEFADRGEQIRSSGDFIAGITKRCVQEYLRKGTSSSADSVARFMLNNELEAFEQDHGRLATNKERDAIAQDIRDTWDAQQRRPSVNFHQFKDLRFDNSIDAADAFGMVPAVELDGTRLGIATSDRTEHVRAGRILAERQAAQVYDHAATQASTALGRALTDAERTHILSRVIANWAPTDPHRPRPNFLEYSTTRSDDDPRKWGNAAVNLTSTTGTAAKRVAGMLVWNAVAEQADAPLAARASMGYKSWHAAKRRVQEGGGPVAIAQAWMDGEQTEKARALFAPFEIHCDRDRQSVANALLDRPQIADELWNSACSLAYTRNGPSFEKFGL